MIKKLKRKFILITMTSLLLVIILLLGAINGLNIYQMEQRTNETIEILSENQGKFPKFEKKDPPKSTSILDFMMNEDTQFKTRYFIVKIDEDGNVKEIDTSHIAAVTSEGAEDYAEEIIENGKDRGYEETYKYAVVPDADGYMLIFLDCTMEMQTVKILLFTSFLVAMFTLLLVFILVSIFSRRAMKPIIESMEKQKQFITDAGHEIKTPIAIISANTDVLELMGEKNEWTDSIRNQTRRLDKLVKNLLMLSRMEEDGMRLSFSEIDLSEAVYETGNSFKAVAQMQGKSFQMNIQPDIKINGDENSIQQLISTLVDNAVKYSNDMGIIRISLSPAKKGVKLEVYNTTEEIKTDKLDRLFDRFYRQDSSRSRETGGYGIGLSIAKSIVEAHHGKISVKSLDGKSICFTVLF